MMARREASCGIIQMGRLRPQRLRGEHGCTELVSGPRPEAAASALAQVPLERAQSRGQAWGGALKPSSGLSPGAAGPRAFRELASRTSHGARSSAHFADEDIELGELNQLGLPEITRLEVGGSFAGSHSKAWVLFTPPRRGPRVYRGTACISVRLWLQGAHLRPPDFPRQPRCFHGQVSESKCSAILMHQNLASLTSAFGDPGEDKRTAWLSQSY